MNAVTIEIPGRKSLTLESIVLDFNGTIAIDGKIKSAVKPMLRALSEQYRIYVITADTRGTAAAEVEGLPVTLLIYNTTDAGIHKRELVEKLGPDRCVCIGNGNNDRFMFQTAALSIAVLESEGLYAPLLMDADMVVRSSEEALELLCNPKRLISGLRC